MAFETRMAILDVNDMCDVSRAANYVVFIYSIPVPPFSYYILLQSLYIMRAICMYI